MKETGEVLSGGDMNKKIEGRIIGENKVNQPERSYRCKAVDGNTWEQNTMSYTYKNAI